MQEFIRYWIRALPFTAGMALSLIALCFLVEFYDRGLDFEDGEIWAFVFFFAIGYPMLLFGIQKLKSG